MVGGNLQLKLPVSMTSNYFNDTPVFYAYPWFFSKRGSVTILPIQSPQIGKLREIVVYRPPSFEENTYKIYPTMIVFDLNEEMYNVSADIINKAIVDKGTIGDFILIGFGDYTREERSSLLTPVDSPGEYFLCINGSREDRCGNCIPEHPGSFTNYLSHMYSKCGRHEELPGKGNDTLDFLINTVIPKAKGVTKNRMLTDQHSFGVMGFSLGGLLACHAAWTMPNTFGFAACQSPAFFWPLINASVASFFFNNVTLKDQKLRTNRPFQKMYLDAGGTETYPPSNLMPVMLAAAKEIHSSGYFDWNKNLWVNVFPDATHSFTTWLSRMWVPLRIFFPTSPAPNMHDADAPKCISPSKIDN